jgi:peptidoglycan/xylan/chitin deacetylase (PgdA/CDA1 family)
MVRSVMKTCFAYVYSGANAVRGLLPGTLSSGSQLPFIVCYHRVVENFEKSAQHAIPSMLISTAMLERHIDWLAKRYSIVSLDEVGSYLESPRKFSKPPAAITFDDGYSDVYYNAIPLLLRKGLPAAVFTVTGLINTSWPQLFDRLYISLSELRLRGASVTRTITNVSSSLSIDTGILDGLRPSADEPFRVMSALLWAVPQNHVEKIVAALEKGRGYNHEVLEQMKPMTWEMVSKMAAQGIIIGSHTKSHALLTNETADIVRAELCESKLALETKLRIPIHHFAYPDGRFDTTVVQAASSAGYRYAYGICRERDAQLPLLTIPRKVLWEHSCLSPMSKFSSAMMNCHVNWVFTERECSRHDHVSIPHMEHYANAS